MSAVEKLIHNYEDSNIRLVEKEVDNIPNVPSYILKLDRDKYGEAETLRFTDPEKYFETIKQLDAYTQFQMQTNLGERLNVLQSDYTFHIENGQIIGENTNEPFIEMIKRGRDYRRENGNPQDFEREDAEVEGFEKIQKEMGRENTEIGTTMVSISPPGGEGSIYQHNFYDVFTLKEDENKKKYISAKRYSSSLTTEEYRQKVQELDENHPLPLNQKDDVFFLANPIVLHEKGGDIADEIHKFMHTEHNSMEKDDFERVLDACSPYIRKYTEELKKDPNNEKRQGIVYNAILNVADEIAEEIQDNKNSYKEKNTFMQKSISEDDIYFYGMQEVRQLDVGCGFSGGYELGIGIFGGQSAPFGVAEFGFFSEPEKKWSYHKGNCRLCKEKRIEVGPCKICKTCEKKFN